jgi:hypothetical protein
LGAGSEKGRQTPADPLDPPSRVITQGGANLGGWILPLSVASRPVLKLDLGSEQLVGGLLVWNYNRESEDDTLRGARGLVVVAEGREVATFTLRKGPASLELDHAQVGLRQCCHDEGSTIIMMHHCQRSSGVMIIIITIICHRQALCCCIGQRRRHHHIP